MLELTWRSLNALLERLHHSYFLYVPLSPDRFVTVEIYLVPAILLLLALALQVRGAHDVLDIQHKVDFSQRLGGKAIRHFQEVSSVLLPEPEPLSGTSSRNPHCTFRTVTIVGNRGFSACNMA